MLVGAIVGAVGGLLNRGVGLYEAHQKAKIDAVKRSDEIELARIQAESDMMLGSYKHDTETGQASQWVIDLLRMVRPSITFYALMLVTIFWFSAVAEDKAIIIVSVLDIASMSVAWWFGSRGIKH